jgi:3-methyladenine DNA glycosylase AlkD
MKQVLPNLRRELRENSEEHTRKTARHFFKEKIKILGVRTAKVTRIAKEHFPDGVGKTKVFCLCEELFKSGIMEESFVACNWSYAIRKEYEKEDFDTFGRWVNEYVSNWATCDTLCNHTIGAFVENFPDSIKELKRWAKSDNRWVKRASAVTLIIHARKGKFLKDIFEIADTLMMDKDDLVQKGYGWMLKAASESHQKEVFDYVIKNKKIMPRTALRYAIEKMPKELRTNAMER